MGERCVLRARDAHSEGTGKAALEREWNREGRCGMSLFPAALWTLHYRQQACLPRVRAASSHTEPRGETNVRGQVTSRQKLIRYNLTQRSPNPHTSPSKEGPSPSLWKAFLLMCVTITSRRQNCWTKQRIKIYYVLVTAIISRMALNPQFNEYGS